MFSNTLQIASLDLKLNKTVQNKNGGLSLIYVFIVNNNKK